MDVRCLDGGSRVAVELDFFEHVSLIRLIATPDLYDGKYVAVDGFLRLEFEGDALYLSAADRKHNLTKNALRVDATTDMGKNQRRLCRGPVSVVGRFDATSHGHGELFGGKLNDIRECTPTNQ
jgi:hypothetical protein